MLARLRALSRLRPATYNPDMRISRQRSRHFAVVLATACAFATLAVLVPFSTAADAANKHKMPARLWLGSDSMAYQINSTLGAKARHAGVHSYKSFCKSITGLARPDFFNWFKKLKSEMRSHHPQTVVFMIGTNDAQNMTRDGKIYVFKTTAWKKLYRHRVAAAMHIMLSNGVKRIYWVGMPIMRSSGFSARMKLLNRIFKAAVAKHAEASYIDAWRLFSDSHGHFVSSWRSSGDGIHFNMAGVSRMTKAIIAAIRRG